jgi:hypothetical protein
VIVVLPLLLALQAGDPPPLDPPDDSAEAPPIDVPDDGDGDDDGVVGDDDGDEAPTPRLKPKAKKTEKKKKPKGKLELPLPRGNDDDDDDIDVDDNSNDVFWDGLAGCGLAGAVPAAGAATGLGLFYGGAACGDAAAVVGGVSGALIGIPSLLLLGPCAGGGAACGASIGAVTSSKDPFTAFAWSLPGIGLGIASGVVASVGVLISSSTSTTLGDAAPVLGTTLVVIGGLGALAAGPVSVAGASLTQEDWVDDDDDDGDDDTLRDGGVAARALLLPRKPAPMTF